MTTPRYQFTNAETERFCGWVREIKTWNDELMDIALDLKLSRSDKIETVYILWKGRMNDFLSTNYIGPFHDLLYLAFEKIDWDDVIYYFQRVNALGD